MGIFIFLLFELKNYFNWYLFIYFLFDGILYIFVDCDFLILDYNINMIVKIFFSIFGEFRNYLCVGFSVMFVFENGGMSVFEVLVCGGVSIMVLGNVIV